MPTSVSTSEFPTDSKTYRPNPAELDILPIPSADTTAYDEALDDDLDFM